MTDEEFVQWQYKFKHRKCKWCKYCETITPSQHISINSYNKCVLKDKPINFNFIAKLCYYYTVKT